MRHHGHQRRRLKEFLGNDQRRHKDGLISAVGNDQRRQKDGLMFFVDNDQRRHKHIPVPRPTFSLPP
ncbi:hypothetical protein WN944_022603 [Citrus x changshan-huyou]|uniref:Uncharacterized protein n=1 Tax=Citrus x changshan-huyou TaxID=2935761 RepID=A0AAP0N3M9_9ROSI